MPGFPIFRIPHLAQLEVLKNVGKFDLIILSFCSERTRTLVESADVQLNHLAFYLQRNLSYENCLRIDVNERHRSFTLIIDITPSREPPRCEIHGRQTQFQRIEFSGESIVGHLMRTFRRVEAIRVYNSTTGILNSPVWKYTRTIEDLLSEPKADEKLSEEEVNFILNELTITSFLEIENHVMDGFRYSEGFQPKVVFICHANWVHFDAILNSKSFWIRLHEFQKPTAEQLNTMLKLWMSMEKMQELNYCVLDTKQYDRMDDSVQREFSPEFLTEALDGIVHERLRSGTAGIRRVDGVAAKVEAYHFTITFHVFSS